MKHKYKVGTMVDISPIYFQYGKIKRINKHKPGYMWDYTVLVFHGGLFKDLGFQHKELSIKEDQLDDLF